MKEIANAADVSIMTVSLSLRNHPRISNETKKSVLKVADKLGYRPDPALGALVAYRSGLQMPAYSSTIAFLNTYPTEDAYKTRKLHRDCFKAAKTRADELGYKLEPFWMGDPSMSEKRARHILNSRNIRGVIIAPMPPDRAKLESEWNAFKIVALGYTLRMPECDRVGTSQFNSALVCMEKLSALGYRRIGYVCSMRQEMRTQGRWAGAVLAYQKHFLAEEYRVTPLLDPIINAKHVSRWIQQEKPDVILAGDSPVIATIKELGLKIPEDIGVAFPYDHELYPDFTCFCEDYESIAAAAVERLVHKLCFESIASTQSNVNLMVDGRWQPGISTHRTTIP